MKIKGHSIIELRNVKTGEIERYEDDNMVTNALQLFLQDAGMMWNSPIKSNEVRNTPIKTLLGGLLLFNNTIPENVNNVVYPGGLTMIGNGSAEYVADGEDGVTEFGSWNYTESGWLSDGRFAMVWDFSTTQANGIINCACLTSRRNGYVGIGNASSQSRRAASGSNLPIDNAGSPYHADPDSARILNRIFDVSVTNSTITYVENKNIVYTSETAADHMGTTGKLKLITKKIPLTKFDLRESYAYDNEGGQNFIPNVETEITLPNAFVGAVNGHSPSLYGKYGDYFYMLADSFNLEPNAAVRGVRINCKTKAVQEFTITNTTSTTFRAAAYGITFGSDTVAIYTTQGSNKLVFQDIFNNPDTTELEVTLNGAYGTDDSGRNGAVFIREGGCIMGANMYIDMVSRTATPINTTMGGRFGLFLSSDNPFLYDYSIYTGGYPWNNDYFSLSYTTDYLATINNLAEPVTKTAEKTMKVTYVLSFDDGE